MSKTFVLSVGGSLVVTKKGINFSFLRQFRKFILEQVKLGYKFYLVVGGGQIARDYIQASLKIAAVNDYNQDLVGIRATRLNAELLKVGFSAFAYPEIIINPYQKINTRKSIILAGGFKPGWSTDYVAVLLALNNKIKKVINLTNIDYVYDRDPHQDLHAKKIKSISWKNFRKIVGNKWQPGLNLPFDPVASQKAAQNKIEVVILNGQKLKNLEHCLHHEKFSGTIIN